MKPKTTLLLLLVAAGIYAFIRFYESGMLTTDEARERAGRVVQFDRDKINAITIKNTETTIELHKDKDGQWMMEKPVRDRADAMAVHQLFTTAESLKSESSVGDEKKGADKDEIKEFGLNNSGTRLTFSGDGKPIELLFGKDAAVEGKLYVRVGGSNVAHIIGTDLKTQVNKKVDEFRDHRLTGLATTQVNRIVLKSTAGEIELDRKDEHWELTKPLKARGDDQKVGDLIAKVTNARIDSFAVDSSNLSTYGLQEPQGTVTMFTEESDQPTVLQIGKPLEKDKLYVKLSSRDSVCVVPKSVETVLETKPNDLRDRKLVRFEPDIVDRITIESATGGKVVLARKGESWVRKAEGKDMPIDTGAASRLLRELNAQQVTKFVADVATDLPAYGLDHPAVKVTLSSFASENTAESGAGEKPIVSLLFGGNEGEELYAKLDDEPFVVSVPRTILDYAMTDPLQWQDLAIYTNKPEDITAFEIARDGQPALSFERNKDNQWSLVKGDGKVNEINVQSLVNTLATLRAVRWVGAASPDQELDKPRFTVTFQTADKTGGKLTIGARTPDALSYASAEGMKGTFALSHPDVTAFDLPLLDKPAAPAPAPAEAPAAEPAPVN